MDTELCREHLEQLLTTETITLKQLDALLDKEYHLITSDDIEGLEKTGSERDACIVTLLKIDADRLSLCRAAGLSNDKVGIKKLLDWCDPQGKLLARWSQSTETILHCRTMNDRNGALINTRLKRVEGLLDTLSGGQTRNERTYTSRGNAYQKNNTGSVCNIKA